MCETVTIHHTLTFTSYATVHAVGNAAGFAFVPGPPQGLLYTLVLYFTPNKLSSIPSSAKVVTDLHNYCEQCTRLAKLNTMPLHYQPVSIPGASGVPRHFQYGNLYFARDRCLLMSEVNLEMRFILPMRNTPDAHAFWRGHCED
jgi:hypothetical protein